MRLLLLPVTVRGVAHGVRAPLVSPWHRVRTPNRTQTVRAHIGIVVCARAVRSMCECMCTVHYIFQLTYYIIVYALARIFIARHTRVSDSVCVVLSHHTRPMAVVAYDCGIE